jgi:hypothetical protein
MNWVAVFVGIMFWADVGSVGLVSGLRSSSHGVICDVKALGGAAGARRLKSLGGRINDASIGV